ncbi:hypothetical protein PISMIDRAFT_533170 [Pisolithus microcarpus 441]|uniref:Uncharacterized protein n=1 Tax=Pisolithus microcarpus 441 TaxID=765257 RepID=A0A0C9YT77_9AGAM|nr:hypothetical protein BKA83DRAFT_533170 [Pisolithus microcarpus]KIK11088.1 hypothetical protein PISMIDRAFT_533170 [Pisolithus microcarpus 441]
MIRANLQMRVTNNFQAMAPPELCLNVCCIIMSCMNPARLIDDHLLVLALTDCKGLELVSAPLRSVTSVFSRPGSARANHYSQSLTLGCSPCPLTTTATIRSVIDGTMHLKFGPKNEYTLRCIHIRRHPRRGSSINFLLELYFGCRNLRDCSRGRWCFSVAKGRSVLRIWSSRENKLALLLFSSNRSLALQGLAEPLIRFSSFFAPTRRSLSQAGQTSQYPPVCPTPRARRVLDADLFGAQPTLTAQLDPLGPGFGPENLPVFTQTPRSPHQAFFTFQ